MTVYFIGAGPGAPDLITLRGARLIETCGACLYAGSLVPHELVARAPAGAEVADSAKMDLDEIVAFMARAHEGGRDVARVHSGDPSLYGATAEQMRRLDALAIPYEVVPGVPAFAAAAARLKTELTAPGLAQSVVLTRVSTGGSPMPPGEELEAFAHTRATLALHLSTKSAGRIVAALAPHYGPDCPVAVVARASWPDEAVLRTTLGRLEHDLMAAGISRTAVILVGPVLSGAGGQESHLYDAGRSR